MKSPYERYEKYSLDYAVLGKPKKKRRKFYLAILLLITILAWL